MPVSYCSFYCEDRNKNIEIIEIFKLPIPPKIFGGMEKRTVKIINTVRENVKQLKNQFFRSGFGCTLQQTPTEK